MIEENYIFQWKDIGELETGRPNLGTSIHVSAYRLMQYTMRSVLNKELGATKTSELFYQSGYVAGKDFCHHLLNTEMEFFDFIAQLQETLKSVGICILRLEKSDLEKMNFVATIYEDADSSGLPITNVITCDYGEGFIAGIFKEYAGFDFDVKEIDCWSAGERACRFAINKKNE